MRWTRPECAWMQAIAIAITLTCLWAATDAGAQSTANASPIVTDADAAEPPPAGEAAAEEEGAPAEQSGTAATPPSLVGNPDSGATKAAVCAGCHGPDGNAVVPIFPKLAGQRAGYLAKQLRDFKAGERVDPVMAGMAAMLSDQDIVDVAAHFERGVVTPGTSDEALAAAGEQIYRKGRAENGLLPCIGCHGRFGEGANGAIIGGFPAVGGQNSDYLVKQLQSFRAGSRANDWQGIMQIIASRLTDEDIAALSAYVSRLPRAEELAGQ